ncbi:MAG: GTPase HflX [Polyangiaceae bacterium]|nr:GTPase HflX [Polyangiaceae bacterium]
MSGIFGNTSGLAPSAHRALERLGRRKVPLDRIATPELVRSLAESSRETGRQVGVLVHRSGEIEWVVVGTATGLLLPDVGRLRAAEGRFRALRLVHTHLHGEPLTADDLTDLVRLRLDLVAAVQLSPEREPRAITWAHIVPGQLEGRAPYQVEGPVPWGHALPDFGRLVAALEAEYARQRRGREVRAKDGRAILVHVGEKSRPGAPGRARARMTELASLAETAGVEVVDRIVQLRERLDPRFVLGKGRLEEVVMRAIDLDAETLIFDQDLTPAQASSLAKVTDLKVIDRSQLILDIFAQRAETRDGKLQVELAQLEYTLPRLGQKDDALSRLTGGIGGRGPGETKLEIGRRRARERVTRLERTLADLARQRWERRRQRTRAELPVVAIVGYTNAGKSTLLNTLTGAGVLAEDRLFATLDTRARRLRLPDGREVLLTDTVGFIRDMPRELFAAFRATFEEAEDADLLLELVDVSDEDHEAQEATTRSILDELGLAAVPRLTVYNKIDRLEPAERDALGHRAGVLAVAAADRGSLGALLAAIAARVPAPLASAPFDLAELRADPGAPRPRPEPPASSAGAPGGPRQRG